jgi:hypothetical protein
MKRILLVVALTVGLAGCSSTSSSSAADCNAARAAYQARVDFATEGDSLKASAEYKAMSKNERAAYDAGTHQALEAMNTACGTGG